MIIIIIYGQVSVIKHPFSQQKKKEEEVTLSLFSDDMIWYIENPKEFTEKLLELINPARLQGKRSTTTTTKKT